MAYKFQLGAARLSGSVVQEGDVTAESSQLNAATIDLDDASGIAGAGLEDQSGDLGIAALGVTNAMLAGNIASSKLAELNAFDTGDLAEGSNLYYTEARWDAKMAAADTGDLAEGSNLYYTEARWDAKMAAADTGDLAEGSNLYFTEARARGSVSVTDAGGDGSLSYDSATGVITYTGPSAAEVRAHLSGGEMIDFASGEMAINASEFTASAQDVIDASSANILAHLSVADSDSVDMSLSSGEFSAVVLVDDSSIEVDSTNGVQVKALGITNAMLAGNIASSKIAELNAFDTADLAEGSNLYYTQARFDAALAAKDTGDLSEGSNLYFTEARARASVSVTDNGGDGSLSYDSSTGVISYTGPSSTEVRAHFSVADTNSIDMSYNASSGEFQAAALVDSDALEVVAGGISLKSSIAGARTFQSDVTVSGDLTVNGSLTYVNTTNLAISDALITIGSGSSAFAVDYGLEFGAVGSGWASIKTAQENIDDQAGDEDIFKFSHPVSSSMMVTEVLSADNIYGDLEGSIIESVQVITAGSQFVDQNQQILCNFASADNLTLPSPSDMEGKVYKFKKIGNGNVEIRPNGSETIDGASSITLESPYAGVSIISDGSDYFVM